MNNSQLLTKGYLIQDNFLTKEQCTQLLNDINNFKNNQELPLIHRESSNRPLHYKVVNGTQIKNNLPEIENLYRDTIKEQVNQLSDVDLVSLSNELIGVNVNLTPSGGTYRWHYDRNLVTVLIYLNEVEGGELELYPLYRITNAWINKFPNLQKSLDSLLKTKPIRSIFGKKVSVKPAEGRMVIMVGNQCLHSVKPVIGDQERVNIVLSYDIPAQQAANNNNLDSYLYSQVEVQVNDPNYLR